MPEQLNPKAQELAKQWDLNSTTTKQYIELMQRYFSTQGFSYTLTPDVTTSSHRIDQFLFEYKNGFCGHYASSVAVLLRSAGIPARLVSGYLGAEYNIQQGYFSVYQYDAHAWVEYFVPNEGWKRLDPTAWVSPGRLLGSLSEHQTLAGEFQQNLGLSLVAWQDFKAINWLRLRLEQLDYQWTRWVLNFDQDKQTSLLQTLFGNKGKQWAGALVVLVISLVLTILFFYVQRIVKVKEPTVIKRYRQLIGFCDKDLSALPPKRAIDELIRQYSEQREMLLQFYADFAANRYQGKSFGKNQNKHAKNLINSIKTKAKR
ncbi:transglutaminase-like domain-containing protein [Pseudoalteromonas sp. T1lg23B]|uniref:transglutaminase-like domain-containing protein n=1 Tax=Pseudoalteromonas sp. T1lg23B TaxID=2077097 RepID=UPI00131A37CA|nr:transglutaminase-like domain-containing protein [Pseudoalteromonas sp. T1lg23B]